MTFTPPATGTIKEYTATATNTAKPAEKLYQTEKAPVTAIKIPGCTDGVIYSVTVDAVSTAGTKGSGKADDTAKCVTAATPPVTPLPVTPPPKAVKPAPPTKVDAKNGAGAKITVTFTASKDDGNGAVTGYTASATIHGAAQPGALKPTTVDGKTTTIVLTGCAPGKSYDASVFSTRGKLDSDPAPAPTAVPCSQ